MSPRINDPVDEVLGAIQALAARAPGASDRRRVQQYLDVFLRWNRTHRMSAHASVAAVARKLFVDSLLFLPLLPFSRPLTVVDIGAGAGIPGLPLRVADPEIALTLIESRRKRISFLLAACRELGLDDIAVIEGRAEALVAPGSMLAGAFDVALARAVGPPEALLPLALKYLKVGGLFIASGSPNSVVHAPLEVVRVQVPGARTNRTFLKAVKTGLN